MQPRTVLPGFGATEGRRSNARARLNIPARVVLLDGYCGCTVENLSRKGARIVCEWELRRGDQGILQRDGLDQFFTVQWVRDGACGLNFEDPVPDESIVALRQVADNFEHHTTERMRDLGREWVEGRAGHTLSE
jgi:hypothetical protein